MILIVLFIWVIFGLIGGSIASSKGRSYAGWFLLCMFLPVLGFILLLVLPSMRDESRPLAAVQQSPSTAVMLASGSANNMDLAPPHPDKKWAALTEYDPVIRDAVAALQPFGTEATDRLREAFMAPQDRQLVPAIVALK